MVLLNTYYHILGVAKNATANEIKTAYRKLTKLYHPDLNGGDRAFESKLKEVEEAYDQLSKPEQRKKHDSIINRAEIQFNGDSEPVTSSSNAAPIQYDFVTNVFLLINSRPLYRSGLPLLLGLLLGTKCGVNSSTISQKEISAIEQNISKTNITYPEWLTDKNFDEFFLDENTKKQLDEFQEFLVVNPTYSCRICGYFSNESDLTLIKKRVNAIGRDFIGNGINVGQITLNVESVPLESNSESDPMSKDVSIQLFDADQNTISSK
jgi:curved DNA-binding protein CbpA